MGGGTRKFRRRNRKREARNEERKTEENKDERRPYLAIVRENEDFVKYYKAQNIVEECEWAKLMDCLRTDLPTAFRIMGCSEAESLRLLDIVKGQFFTSLVNGAAPAGEEAKQKKEPFALPWYPGGLGWQLEISRKDIRRSEAYFRLHNFLTSETACGAISRQEAVSMIPPLCLDVKPNHKVLDMCAAPGSKTAQLIELLHHNEPGTPGGFVIANDIDNSRCYMLVHQSKRLNSPCVMVTNHDSSCMANFAVGKPDGTVGVLKFDRILCDVPCCGDGTLRKNPDIWQKWNTANGNNLHGIQYRILKRGLEMLEVGGKIVYSTCSLNPVENEGVIHRMLSSTEGALELLDIRDKLPGLKTRPGMKTWMPASRDLKMYASYEEVDEKWQTQVRPSMFPPDPAKADDYHLERCIRVVPHHQDTGGFFVAVLCKTRPLPWEVQQPQETAPGDDPGPVKEPQAKREPERKRRRIQGYREDPYVFFEPDEPIWKDIRDFYGIEGLDSSCLLTRCVIGKKKNIYFVSPAMRDLITGNQNKIKIINTGVKVFARSDNKLVGCNFRLVQEGLDSIKQYITDKRRIKVSRQELVDILYQSDPKEPLEISKLSEETQKRLEDVSQGSCVLDFDEDLKLSMVGWKGNKSLRAYVASSDLVHYLRLLGADVTKFEVNKFKKEAEAPEPAGAGDATRDVAMGDLEISEGTEVAESG